MELTADEVVLVKPVTWYLIKYLFPKAMEIKMLDTYADDDNLTSEGACKECVTKVSSHPENTSTASGYRKQDSEISDMDGSLGHEIKFLKMHFVNCSTSILIHPKLVTADRLQAYVKETTHGITIRDIKTLKEVYGQLDHECESY